MKSVKFETNIKNESAINKLRPQLDSIHGIVSWKFNENNHGKFLTFKGDEINSKTIRDILFSAGIRCNEVKPIWRRTLKNFFKKDCCK